LRRRPSPELNPPDHSAATASDGRLVRVRDHRSTQATGWPVPSEPAETIGRCTPFGQLSVFDNQRPSRSSGRGRHPSVSGPYRGVWL